MPATPSHPSASRLWSVDVLRGSAALGVVVYHAVGVGHLLDPREVWPTYQTLLPRLASIGASGVMLFFVISGFCIHLRQARAGASGVVQWGAFWRRRFFRLYPAYLAALILYAGSLTLRGAWKGNPAYELALHLGLVQNLDPRVAFSLTGVFWSLAVEEQLYALYPALLYLRERRGWRTTLLALFGIRFATFVMCDWSYRTFGISQPFGASAPALWICWALGAFAAEAYCGRVRLARSASSGWISSGLVVGSLLLKDVQYLLDPSTMLSKLWWLLGQPALPVLTALGYFIGLNAAIAREGRALASDTMALWVRGLAGVGLFSYSLYLTHEWVFRDLGQLISELSGDSGSWLADRRPLLIPACVGVAYVFYLMFERPFLAAGTSNKSPAERRG